MNAEGEELTAEEMEQYHFPKKELSKISNRIVAIFDGKYTEKYDGITATTKRDEEDENYKGSLLKFKLMIQKKSGELLPLQYPFDNFDGQKVMKPADLVLSVTYLENN